MYYEENEQIHSDFHGRDDGCGFLKCLWLQLHTNRDDRGSSRDDGSRSRDRCDDRSGSRGERWQDL